MTYTLTVKETNNKAGKFHYQVIDETGKMISERKSNREYVACTIDGVHYFGRLDLIGKGDHGRLLKRLQYGNPIKDENGQYKTTIDGSWVMDGIPIEPTPIAYRKS